MTGQRPGSSVAMQALLLPSSSDRLLGPKCWPRVAASWRDVVHIRDKTITRIQHMAKGVETGARGW